MWPSPSTGLVGAVGSRFNDGGYNFAFCEMDSALSPPPTTMVGYMVQS